MKIIGSAKSNSGDRVWFYSDDTFTAAFANVLPTEKAMQSESTVTTETYPELLAECFSFDELAKLARKATENGERLKIAHAMAILAA